MSNALLSQAQTLLDSAEHIAIITHISPDGDAIGSALGFALALRDTGKTVTPVCGDKVPNAFHYLNGYKSFERNIPLDADIVVTVDAASLDRIGNVASSLEGQVHINIDHHISNTNFAEINLVSATAASTAEYLVEILDTFEIPISAKAARALLTGIVTDTQGFRTSNTTPSTVDLARSLMERGANIHEISELALHRRSLAAVNLWGQVLQKVTVEDGIAWATIDLQDKQASGYTARGDADIVQVLSSIEGIEVALVIIEGTNRDVKISWRATGNVDVSAVASEFGGGGHRAAAGARISNIKLAEATQAILAATKQAINAR